MGKYFRKGEIVRYYDVFYKVLDILNEYYVVTPLFKKPFKEFKADKDGMELWGSSFGFDENVVRMLYSDGMNLALDEFWRELFESEV